MVHQSFKIDRMSNSQKRTKRFVSNGKTYRVVLQGNSITLFLQGSKEVLVG